MKLDDQAQGGAELGSKAQTATKATGQSQKTSSSLPSTSDITGNALALFVAGVFALSLAWRARERGARA